MSNEKHETISDIVAEMRNLIKGTLLRSGEELL